MNSDCGSRKFKYSTMPAAQRVAKRMEMSNKLKKGKMYGKITAYKCRECGFFHVGSTKRLRQV